MTMKMLLGREAPCKDQDPAAIEEYYRNAPEGSKAVVRIFYGGLVDYLFREVGSRTKNGQLHIKGESNFYPDGRNCYHPKGQTSLVLPTREIEVFMGYGTAEKPEPVYAAPPPPKPHSEYTLEDLEEAKAEQKLWDDRWCDYTGNNPNKYSTERRNARYRVEGVTKILKENGTIPYTPEELATNALNKLYPYCKNGTIAVYEGKKYRAHVYVKERSRSRKTVTAWGRDWHEIKPTE